MSDINQLTGPALDAAVAREVMGWELVPIGYDLGGYGSLPKLIWHSRDPILEIPVERWRPSTDHNDLHRVIERMRERGYRIMLEIWPDGDDDPKYISNVHYMGKGSGARYDGDTINTAVLRACLLAVRSEKT